MPDPTRTSRDACLLALRTDLLRVARLGLLTQRLAYEHERRGGLHTLLALVDAQRRDDAIDRRARDVIQRIVAAIGLMPGRQLREEAIALFGIEDRYRDVPYEQRRGHAVAIWDPGCDKNPDSFTRRELPKILQELVTIVHDYEVLTQAEGSPTRDEQLMLARARLEADSLNDNWQRIDFRAETWLTGEDQHASHTDWTFKDRAIASGVSAIAIRMRADADVRVEPTSENIRLIERAPPSREGHQQWVALLRDSLDAGQDVEWSTRRTFGPSKAMTGGSWFCLSAHGEGIRKGFFTAHFDMRFPPSRVAAFETERGTLPHISGLIEDKRLTKDGVARALFSGLKKGKTYGLCWWNPKWPEFDPIVK